MKTSHLFRASIAVSAATILIRLVGFLREVILAAAFGAGAVSDAFVIAMTVPGIVLLIFKNTINTVYIPKFTGMSDENEKAKYTNNLLTFLFAVGLVFAVVFTVFPQALVYVFAADISPESFKLATDLLRIMVWSSIPMLMAGVYKAFLQIKSIFFVPLISDALVNLLVIVSIVTGRFSGSTMLLGIGAVVGNVANLIVVMVISLRQGLRYRPYLNFKDEQFRQALLLMLPIMISSAAAEIGQIVDKNLASSLALGTVSALNYSSKINNVFAALIGASISTALFPKLSELAIENDFRSIKKYVVSCIDFLIPMLLPITVGIITMSQPVTRILLERGAFQPEDTARTAECLRMYTIGLIAGNINPLIIRVFYAMQRNKIPTILSVISIVVDIVLNFALFVPLKHMGLALSTSLGACLYLLLLLAALRRSIGPLGLNKRLGEYLKISFAAVIMCAVVLLALRLTPVLSSSYLQNLVWSVLIACGGALVYALVLIVTRADIIATVLTRLRKI